MACFKVMVFFKALLMLALLLVAELRSSSAVITCANVRESLQPCVHYVKGNGHWTPLCCSGVKQLNAAAKTWSDWKTVCSCLQQILNPNFHRKDLIPSIPQKCGVKLPYPINQCKYRLF